MEDFMPCKGCDEPEACVIEGRCLEPEPQPLTDEQAEALIENSGGHWKEDVFCIGGPELMALLRAASVMEKEQGKETGAAGVGVGGGGQGKDVTDAV
jgi:hypothetical protein